MRPFVTVFVTAIIIAAASPALADVWDPDLSTTYNALNSSPGWLLNCPCGDGDRLDQMHTGVNNDVVDGTIYVQLVNTVGNPMPAYPAEDIWIEAYGGSFNFIQPGTIADHATDVNGQTEFVEPLAAGGSCYGSNYPLVYVAGTPMLQIHGNLNFISPDITGDLRIDLADLSLFVAAYFGTYDPRADFVANGIMNIADVAVLAAHFGHNCP